MALRTNKKVGFDRKFIDRSLHVEIYDDISVDDVVAFMAQSEATRKYRMAPRGISRATQRPSDELKSYIRNTGE